MAYPRPTWFRWWLFPASAAVHFCEELFAGGGFYTWITAMGGTRIPIRRFGMATAFAFVSMTVAAWIARKRYDWLLFALAAIIVTNALTHFIASLATDSYSPGTVSGLVLWLPLGGAILYRGFDRKRAAIWSIGVAIGTLMNAAILIFTMHMG